MTAEEAVPFWTEDPRGLLNFACGTRRDWSREDTWKAIHAAHNAGLPWERVCKRLIALVFRADGSPLELRDEVRREQPAPRGSGPDPSVMDALRAGNWEQSRELLGTESVVPHASRVSGAQPVLREAGEGGTAA